jgi:hypothetical protein
VEHDRIERPFSSTLRRGNDGTIPSAARQGRTLPPQASAKAPKARRRRRERVQVVLQLMPGAEAWVRVEHRTGAFSIPACASIQECLSLAGAGARDRRKATTGEATVRVPLSVWRALNG